MGKGIEIKGSMKDVCAELQADHRVFGNISVLDYIEIKRNIAKYGIAALNYYKQQIRAERLEQLREAEAYQFGLSEEEFRKQVGV